MENENLPTFEQVDIVATKEKLLEETRVTSFAKKHGLSQGSLSQLLNRHWIPSEKEWPRYAKALKSRDFLVLKEQKAA